VNLEKSLSFVTHRSESIIQWLFLAILILSGILIARALFGKKSEEGAAAIPSGGVDLQTALQKIMEQTTKLESVSLEKLNSKDVAAVDAQVQALKADLAARESEIAKLKEAGQAAPAAASGPELDQLSARIKELEGKLAEYEILEDDIADLSLYKEENARLKAEIEKVKSGGAAVEPAAAAEPAKPVGEAIVEEFTQAVNTPPMAEGETQVVSGEIPDTGDPMKDFESTMSLEKKLEAVAPGVPGAPEPVLSPPPSTVPDTSAAVEVAAAQAEADDLFAEFSTGDEQLDTEKMMAEMAALVNMEPATGNSLEESIDTEKMAAEASSLTKA
jgi:hypothetical protein